MNETSLLGAIIPLVLVIVGLSQLLQRTNSSNIDSSSALTKKIETLQEDVGVLKGIVAQLKSDNEELKRDNDALMAENKLWRNTARKWYLIAVSINKDFANQAEDGLAEPTDL